MLLACLATSIAMECAAPGGDPPDRGGKRPFEPEVFDGGFVEDDEDDEDDGFGGEGACEIDLRLTYHKYRICVRVCVAFVCSLILGCRL